jgi:anaerobic selenocysteine-containing dehydrogenase
MSDEFDMVEDPRETEEAEEEVNADPGFKEGDEVWVEDAEGRRHAGVFVGMNEASGWFGGGPSAYVIHPEAHQAEVVSLARITRRG